MTLEVVLMNICQNRKPAVSQIFMSTLLHERKMIKKNFPSEENEIFRLACWRNVLFQLSCW